MDQIGAAQHRDNPMTQPTCFSSTTATNAPVHVLIVNANGMDACSILDLAEQQNVVMILDSRTCSDGETTMLERLLGPCYTSLPSDIHQSCLYISKLADIVAAWRDHSSILILAQGDQVELMKAKLRVSCPSCITIGPIRNDSHDRVPQQSA